MERSWSVWPLILGASCAQQVRGAASSPEDAAVSARADTPVGVTDAREGVAEPPRTFCDAVPPSDDVRVTVPDGFCVRRYARVPMARVLAFAPNGDLFVSSPGFAAHGGTGPGLGAVLRLAERGRYGLPTSVTAFLEGVARVHGIAFADRSLLYTESMRVMRVPWTAEASRSVDTPQLLGRVSMGERYTQTLDVNAEGAIHVSYGRYDRQCEDPRGGGGVAVLDPARPDEPHVIMRGARNPMYVRCFAMGCFAMELPTDHFINTSERLFRLDSVMDLRADCCADRGRSGGLAVDCASVPEPVLRIPHHSVPFGFDRAPSSWPSRWRAGWFVALHGQVRSWFGAGVAFVPDGSREAAPPAYFSGAWGRQGGLVVGRPADVRFAPDGRLFIADDASGAVYWVAPITLRPQG